MLNKKSIAAMMLLATTAACATPRPLAAPIVSASALCLIDRVIPAEVAPAANVDDPGNKFTDDKTYDHIDAHNARLRAACPSD